MQASEVQLTDPALEESPTDGTVTVEDFARFADTFADFADLAVPEVMRRAWDDPTTDRLRLPRGRPPSD